MVPTVLGLARWLYWCTIVCMSSLPAPTASRVDAALGSVVSSRRVRELEHGRPVGFAILEPVSDAAISALVDELVGIDPEMLHRADRLRLVLLADRVSGWGRAQASRALAANAGPAASDEADPAAEARRDRALRLAGPHRPRHLRRRGRS
jgi:hypothetical protein